jgi:hypothetical protein
MNKVEFAQGKLIEITVSFSTVSLCVKSAYETV